MLNNFVRYGRALLWIVALALTSHTQAQTPITLFGTTNDVVNFTRAGGGAVPWTLTSSNSIMVVPGTGNIQSTQSFGDFVLHAEFLLPAAGNGNCGIYLQGRYEIQIFNSFGVTTTDTNDCGAIWGLTAPSINACRAPGIWQSYDIYFQQPQWNGNTKVANARVTVVLNGVTVQNNVAIANSTVGGVAEAPTSGPIVLQDNSSDVQFRNITITPYTVVAGTVRNALNGQTVPGVSVTLNGGATAVTTAQGQFTFTNVPVSTVAISAAAAGFNSYFNGFALTVVPTNVISFAMSPAIANTNTMRLVLNWGASPSDLDSHLETPVIGATNYHVYFGDRGSLSFDPFASLDVDDVTGFGPETITITNFFTGTYHYYVHNFSGFFGGGQTLAGCGATAQLYTSTGLAAAVQVPATGVGDYWYVARIDGDSRVVTIVNQVTNQVPVVLGAPTFTNLPQSVVTNLGATAVFNVGATGTGPLSYQWRLNGVNISGANGTMLAVSNIQLGNRGQYTCLVSSPLGSIITQPATLSLNTVAAIVQPQFLSVPPGTNVTFLAGVIGLGVFQYQWRFFGINIPGATNTSLTLTNVQVANGGSYSFVVSSPTGTPLTTADASLEVLRSPSITSHPVGATNLAGDTVNFIVERLARLRSSTNGSATA